MSFVRSTRTLIRKASVVLCSIGALTWSSSVAAQPPTSGGDGDLRAPAHVSVAEGSTTIDRDDEVVTATAGEALVPGDRLTTSGGRAEIWFADGSTLAIDERSSVELLSETLIRLDTGRVYLTVARRSADGREPTEAYRIDTASGSLIVDEPGEYGVSLASTPPERRDEVELTVIRGSAALQTGIGSQTLRSGERLVVRADGGASYPERFNAARLDPFERWAVSLHAPRRTRTTSSQYLPQDLRMYGSTLDQYGAWEYEPSYGYVWYPGVEPGWRPYYQGYWRPLPRYGWTWIAGDRWGWPTHHYGRWGYGRSRWFWIPDRRWGPAWVSWASAADFVSWCPLGFDNRPVFNFSLSVGNSWAGWVVLPRHSFGLRNAWVSHHAFDGRRLPRSTAFAVHARAPIAPTSFRPRGSLRVDDRFNRRDRGLGPDGGRRADRAVPRASRPRGDWSDTTRPSPLGGARATRRFDPRNDIGTTRGRAGRTEGPDGLDGRVRHTWRPDVAVPRERPTPQNPRAGIRVDPGVPRAGDRLDPYANRQRFRSWPDRGLSGEAARRDRTWPREAPFVRGSLPPPNPITPPPNSITAPPGSVAVPRSFGEMRSFDDGSRMRGGSAHRSYQSNGGRPDGGAGRAVPRGEAAPSRRGEGRSSGDGGGGRRGGR